MFQLRVGAVRRSVVVALVSSAVLLVGLGQGSAHANVSAVTGGAYGYSCSVMAFGIACSPVTPTPKVALAADASNSPQAATVASGNAFTGPATVFSSGQIDVRTQGTLGPGGSVTSSTNIANVNASGNEALTASSLASSCTASEAGGATGSTTINGGTLQIDNGDSDPTNTIPDHAAVDVPLPANPAPNTSYDGHVHIGNTTDTFTYVFNEQVVGSDGSITVNAVHEFPHGPAAVGEAIVGQSVCGVTAAGDTTPPETAIDSGPSGTISSASAAFAFSSSETGSTFECKLDGPGAATGAWGSCTSPKDYSGLADGAYTFSVRATDAAGNTDATPATRTFTVETTTGGDTTPPETAIDSGPSGTISSPSAAFAFSSSETGSTFECKLDGPGAATGAWGSCTSPKDYSGLADGAYTFSVRATDAAGNTDATPATRTFTAETTGADTTPPDTTIDSGPSGTISSASAEFTFSSSESGSTFECKLDRPGAPGSWGSSPIISRCTSPKAYTDLADGTYTFSVRATDAAGNTDPTPATRTFTVDTTPVSGADLSVDLSDSPDPVAARGRVTYSVNVTNDGPDTATGVTVLITKSKGTKFLSASGATCTVVKGIRCDLGSIASGDSKRFSIVIKVGSKPVSVRATVSSSTSDPVSGNNTDTEDTAIAPETAIDAGPSGTISSASPGFEFSSSEAGSTFECKLDGPGDATGDWGSCSSPKDYTDLADGDYTFSVRATDAAGNTDPTPATRTFTVDTTPPDTTIDAGPSGTTSSASPALEFSSSEAGSTFECKLDGPGDATGDWGSCSSPKDYTDLADGDYTFSVRATDAAGNTDPTPATRTFTVDTTPVSAADLSVDLSDSPDPVAARGRLIYSVKVTNDGPDTARRVRVLTTTSQGTKFRWASGARCTEVRGRNAGIRCRLGSIASGDSKRFAIVVRVGRKPVSATSTVSSRTSDPVSENNADTEDTAIARPRR